MTPAMNLDAKAACQRLNRLSIPAELAPRPDSRSSALQVFLSMTFTYSPNPDDALKAGSEHILER